MLLLRPKRQNIEEFFLPVEHGLSTGAYSNLYEKKTTHPTQHDLIRDQF